ncbi:hypothetical protein AB0K08_13860 [Citricoccus sp. NPDC055426]|uniref:hypothetical protein n=1 Tax=Citricoccus sp. NPDC055426 TaxID=3155536 RepID=UPI003449A6E1
MDADTTLTTSPNTSAPSDRRPLGRPARDTLAMYDVTAAEWSRHHFGTDHWSGDWCGCPDDRCRGHHHDPDARCGCLTALLDDGAAWLTGGAR